MDPVIISRIANDLSLPEQSVAAAIALFEKGATAPFIVRYRKEITGGMDELKIRLILERMTYYREILDRRVALLKLLTEQAKLTDELRKRIERIFTKTEIEDLSHQFRPRKKARAAEAIAKGLEPLAEYLWNQEPDAWSLEEHVDVFIVPEKNVASREQALQGAVDIIAEWISENSDLRRALRELLWKEGYVVSTVVPAKAGQKTKYNMYYDRRESVTTIPSHRVLAIRRGSKEGILASSIEGDHARALGLLYSSIIRARDSVFAPILEAAIRESYHRLLKPLIETSVRAQLKERADREAIRVFQENLTNLLLSPPAGSMVVMGIDAGKGNEYRVAVVGEQGNVLNMAAIRFTASRRAANAKEALPTATRELPTVESVQPPAIAESPTQEKVEAPITEVPQPQTPDSEAPTEASEVAAGPTYLLPPPTTVPEDVVPEAPAACDAEMVVSPEEPALQEPGSETLQLTAITAFAPVEPFVQSLPKDIAKPKAPLTRDYAAEARATLLELIHKYNVQAIAIGSGAGERELEAILRQFIADEKLDHVLIAALNDAGIAIYSSSRIAREEFPDSSASARCAASFARRLQDPLAEMVKIDPKLIGVGQYQHDVDQKELHRGLLQVVQFCVNKVGVNLNSASESLLRYVAGLNDKQARRIVAFRNSRGHFPSRGMLAAVAGIDANTYQQAAGFLRVTDGENPLDRTAIHPESYPIVEKIALASGVGIGDLIGNKDLISSLKLDDFVTDLAGLPTLADIREELLKPGRDPRKVFTLPKFRSDVRGMADLKPGMTLEGTVTNVTNFGAFVDIGVRQDGLVHLSQISNRFIRDPREAVKVGDVVQVKVISVELDTKRIGLSIKAMLPPLPRRRKKQEPIPTKPMPAAAPVDPAAEVPRRNTALRAAAGTGPREVRRPMRARRRPPRTTEKPVPPTPHVAPEAPDPKPTAPEPTLQQKIAILQSKFKGIG